MKITTQQLVDALRSIADLIEKNDSYEGTISYSCLEEGLKPGEFEATSFIRVGNREGQGGARIMERSK